MTAPVERRHREAAVAALREYGSALDRWITTGKCKPGQVFNTDLIRIAQALADFEAAGKREAWADGYAQCEEDLDCETSREMRTENPYPDTESKGGSDG